MESDIQLQQLQKQRDDLKKELVEEQATADKKYNDMQTLFERGRLDLVEEIDQLRGLVDQMNAERVVAQEKSDISYNSMQARYEESRLSLLDVLRDKEGELGQLRHENQMLSRLHDDVVMDRWDGRKLLPGHICTRPFVNMRILPDGSIMSCCGQDVKKDSIFGNLYEQTATFDQIWNSNNAKKLRYGVYNGEYEFCQRMCSWLKVYNQGSMGSMVIPRKDFPYQYSHWDECTYAKGPEYIALSIDLTCNLTCPSCRAHSHILPPELRIKMERMLETVLRPALIDCKRVTALGSGEFFASRPILDFFRTIDKKNYPQLRITVMTNGQLVTPKTWDSVSNLHGVVDRMTISIDAAEKETYERLRRGGALGDTAAKYEVYRSASQRRPVGLYLFQLHYPRL